MRILPTREERERDLTWVFDLALWLKVVNGGIEIVAAFLVFVIPPSLVLHLAELVTSGEVGPDADDYVATSLTTIAKTATIEPHHLFALYLAVHGAVKVILVVGIFRKKRLAYPLFMLALLLFGTYEAYRGLGRHDPVLGLLAVFDLLLLFLTLHEYRRRYPGGQVPVGGAGSSE